MAKVRTQRSQAITARQSSQTVDPRADQAQKSARGEHTPWSLRLEGLKLARRLAGAADMGEEATWASMGLFYSDVRPAFRQPLPLSSCTDRYLVDQSSPEYYEGVKRDHEAEAYVRTLPSACKADRGVQRGQRSGSSGSSGRQGTAAALCNRGTTCTSSPTRRLALRTTFTIRRAETILTFSLLSPVVVKSVFELLSLSRVRPSPLLSSSSFCHGISGL